MRLNKKLLLIFFIKIFVLLLFLSCIRLSQPRQQIVESIPAAEETVVETATTESIPENIVDEGVIQSGSVRIGASCVTEPARFTTDVAVAEARHVIGREQSFWEVVDISLANNIYLIVNIIVYNIRYIKVFIKTKKIQLCIYNKIYA